MTSRSPQDLAPLTSETLIEERVLSLIGRASHRQIWFLFVDRDSVQLPLLVPLDNHPLTPAKDDIPRVAGFLTQVADMAEAAGVVIVLERYGGARLTPSDLTWARLVHQAAAVASLGLRGILLSHATGVRWVAPDDYLVGGGGDLREEWR
ncbi:MAG: hypothetical protein H7146_04220 [Burkholderiaceae bacterium]|nr:hypothetical protein [Microbacteriaceae bacterium]